MRKWGGKVALTSARAAMLRPMSRISRPRHVRKDDARFRRRRLNAVPASVVRAASIPRFESFDATKRCFGLLSMTHRLRPAGKRRHQQSFAPTARVPSSPCLGITKENVNAAAARAGCAKSDAIRS